MIMSSSLLLLLPFFGLVGFHRSALCAKTEKWQQQQQQQQQQKEEPILQFDYSYISVVRCFTHASLSVPLLLLCFFCCCCNRLITYYPLWSVVYAVTEPHLIRLFIRPDRAFMICLLISHALHTLISFCKLINYTLPVIKTSSLNLY